MATVLTPRAMPTSSATAPPEPRHRLRSWLIERYDYLITALFGAAIAQTWFQGQLHIAAGDVTPYIRDSLAKSLTDLWGYQLTGAGSPSYEIARIFDVAILEAVGMLGMDGAMGQRVFYSVLAVLTSVAGTYLVATFSRRPSIRIAGGVWAVANPYWLVLIPNPLFLIAIAIGALSAGFLIRASRGEPPRITTVVISSLLLAPVAVNPPLLAVLIAWVLMLLAAGRLLGGPGGFARVVVFSLKAIPGVIAINLFWIVPAVIVFTTESAVVAAEVSAEAWSWSHAQNTIPNVVGLNAHWGWAFPDTYFPFAPRLDSPWLNWMRFFAPALAVAAPLLARSRRRIIALTMVSLAAVASFIGKGLHPPLAEANLWLYENIPGMWLLREPMSKVGWLTVLAYLVAAGIAANALLDRASTSRRWRIPLVVVPAAVAAAALIYVHPLWTGEAVPQNRHDLPSSHVAVPAAWHEAAEAVDALGGTGTAVTFPIPEFYQMGHTWGYYGADELPTLLVTRRTMQPSSGGYFSDPATYRASFDLLEDALVTQDRESASRLLEALGVSTVVVRHDYAPEVSQGDLVDPAVIDAGLESLDNAELVYSTDVTNIWHVSLARPRLSATTNVVELQPDSSAEATARALAATKHGFALVSEGLLTAEERRSFAWVIESPEREISLTAPADLVISVTPIAPPAWRFTPSLDGIEATAVDRLIADGKIVFWKDPVFQPLDGPPSAIAVGDRIIPLYGAVTVPVDDSQSVEVYSTAAWTELGDPLDGRVGDCNSYDDRTPEEAGLGMDSITDGVRLSAVSHSACARYALPSDHDGILRVSIDALGVAGSPPRMCVYSASRGSCVADDQLDSGSGELSALVTADSDLEVYVYADEPSPNSGATKTINEYRRPRVETLQATGSLELPDFPQRVILSDLDTEPHTIGADQTTMVSLEPPDFSPLQDCHRHDTRSIEEAGLSLSEPEAGTIQLQAAAHSACVSAGLGTPKSAVITLDLEYRAISGASPRICLWQEGPDNCADLPALARATGWQHYRATTTLDLEAQDLRLYLYADAPPADLGGFTVAEYRNLSLVSAMPWTVVASTETEADHAVPLEATSSPDRVAAKMPQDAPDGPMLLILNDTFDSNWTLAGASGGQHIRVDGWANGWFFDDASRLAGADLVLSYQPARWARLARAISAATLISALVVGAVALVRNRLHVNKLSEKGAQVVQTE